MIQKKLAIIFLTMLLIASAAFLPVLAQEEELPDPVEYEETDTLKVPDSEGRTTVEKDYVYVTGDEKLGIDMTAKNQNGTAKVNGEVFSEFGGAWITADAGTADLTAGNIHGGYGIFGIIRNGGTIKALVEDIFAAEDAGLDIVIPGAGTLNFEGGDITSDSYGVTLLTGTEDDSYPVDPIPDPGEDDWIDPSPVNSPDPEVSGDNDPAPDDGSDQQNAAEGTSDSKITFLSVDSKETGVDVELNNASKVTLNGEAVFSDDKGVEIELSDQGGTVTMDTPIIDAENQGLVITAAAGEVTVKNNDYIDANSAIEITNEGGTVSLPEGGDLIGNSGVYVEATGGTTTVSTGDISAQNYGVSVWTYAPDPYEPYDPDENGSGSGTQGSSDSGDTAGSKPKVEITVNGGITDQIDMTMPEVDWDVEPDPDPEDGYESSSFTKDASGNGDEEDPENPEAKGSVGIIVNAEAESNIDISVSNEISMSYGNEIEAYDNAQVNVSVDEYIYTDYGNRISSSDGATVKFTVGEDIDAGGKALETFADSGNIEILVDSIVAEENDEALDTAGIDATSMGTGKTEITVKDGIEVISENSETDTYGIDLYNIGGKITVLVGNDVTAEGPGAVGMEVSNLSEENAAVASNVEITGNLAGTSKGLVFDTEKDTNAKADILVTETISGTKAGVEVSEDAAPNNFDLTVWKIESGNGHAAVKPDGSAAEAVEPEIKYIIKIDPDSESKIEAVKEDGSAPEKSHGFMYQKQGQRVYVRGINGYEVTEAYNGKQNRTPLTLDENSGLFYLEVPNGGGIWLTVEKSPVPPRPEPVNPGNHMDFYRIGDLSWLNDVQLPATGFSASHVTALPARPQGLSYGTTGLTLQIPGLDVAEAIVTVPEDNGSYPVEWLDRSVGLLEQSSLPGEGVTVLTGHNHLNTTETGPFLFIGKMEENDRIMITDADNEMRIYKVYGNYKIASDGFAEIAPAVRENALVLITCEDESVEGGYLNRRVVLAEPL